MASARRYESGSVIAEIIRRDVGSFGCRFMAWVAWRDAGDVIRSHTWHEIHRSGIVADSVVLAQQLADLAAKEYSLTVTGTWVPYN